MTWLVKTYTNRTSVVIEPFMGSGTTGVACIKTGRKFVGIEQDEKIFNIACGRLRRAIQDISLLTIIQGEGHDDE